MTSNGQPLSPDLIRQIAAVRAVVFDFDGVFTDNSVFVGENGAEYVRCCRSDGIGLASLRELDIPMAIISAEPNEVVLHRAKKMKIPCHRGVKDKLACLRKVANVWGVGLVDIAFVGNDVNDADCLGAVGFPVVVADAHKEIIPLARLVLTRPGGCGAVREWCDLLRRVKDGGGK